jgi:hypothetical protein
LRRNRGPAFPNVPTAFAPQVRTIPYHFGEEPSEPVVREKMGWRLRGNFLSRAHLGLRDDGGSPVALIPNRVAQVLVTTPPGLPVSWEETLDAAVPYYPLHRGSRLY